MDVNLNGFIAAEFNIGKPLKDDHYKLVILCRHKKSKKRTIIEISKTYNPPINFDQYSEHFDEITMHKHSENYKYFMVYLFLNKDDCYKARVTWLANCGDISMHAFEPTFNKESKEDYERITKPFLEQNAPSVEWVYNILEGKKEQKNVVIRDKHKKNGFVLVRDPYWDFKDVKKLSYCAFVKRRDLRSIRGLTKAEVPLLSNIQSKCLKAISDETGVEIDKIYAAFHYLPNYYHLHVHFKYRNKPEIQDSFFSLKKYIGKLKSSNYIFPKCLNVYCPIPELSEKLPKYNDEKKERFRLEDEFEKLGLDQN